MTRRRKRAACQSGKVRYRSEDEAVRALRTLARTSTRDTVPHRTYECPWCHGFHLSSKEAW